MPNNCKMRKQSYHPKEREEEHTTSILVDSVKSTTYTILNKKKEDIGSCIQIADNSCFSFNRYLCILFSFLFQACPENKRDFLTWWILQFRKENK